MGRCKNPQTLEEWSTYIQVPSDKRFMREAWASNSLSFVKAMLAKIFENPHILSILVRFGEMLRTREIT